VAAQLHSNVPDRFTVGMRLYALSVDRIRRELEVEDLWPHKGYLVLKFVGIDSMSDAEALSGCELQVPREQRAQLESGWSFVSDLIGCAVWDGERELGEIKDVTFGAGEAPLLVVASGAREYEIPYAEAYIRRLDIERRQIRMQLPEGLLDVNAPLTAEEKEQQRKQH
jgi:16S rRNA processing protein RimM